MLFSNKLNEQAFSAKPSSSTAVSAVEVNTSEPGSLVVGRLRRMCQSGPGYYGLTFGGFLLLAIIYTWPTILEPGRTIPGDFQADQYQNIWSLWWLKHSLLDHPTNPFFTNYLFYPTGSPLYLHALNPLGGLLMLPVTLLGGPIAAFSILCISGLALTGLAATALCRVVSGSRLGGLVAGYALAFSVIHFNYVGLGQLEFVALWPLLFYLTGLAWLMYRWPSVPGRWRQLKAARWVLAGTILSLVAAVSTTLYYGAFAALFTALLGLFRLLQERRLALLGRVGLVWLIFGSLFAPFALKVLEEQRSGDHDLSVPYPVLLDQSVAPHSFLSQFSGNTLLGQLLGLPRSLPLNISHYLGFSLLLLAIGGLWAGRGRLWPWLASGLFFASLSFGPSLRWQAEPNPPQIPPQPFMPWNWFHKLPLFSLTNNPMRFELLFLIAIAVLAACGVAEISRRWASSGLVRGAGGLLLVGLVLESAGLPLTRPVEVPPQVSVVQADCQRVGCGEAAVLDLPFSKDHYLRDANLMLWGALRQQPIMGGYLSRREADPYDPENSPFRLFRQLTPLNDIFSPDGDDAALQILNYYNIRYITVNPHEYQRIYTDDETGDGSALREFLERFLGHTALIYTTPTLQIYRVPTLSAGQSHPFVVVGDGWYKTEAEQPPKRWNRRVSDFDIYTFEPGSQTLSFEATAFAQPRTMRVTLNGQLIGQTIVPAGQWQTFSFKLPLTAGDNNLQIESVEAPQSPAALDPASKDTRPLSLALRQVKVS